jgi:hypothetical protein
MAQEKLKGQSRMRSTAATTKSSWAPSERPDPLQFVHSRLPHEPLRTLQRFNLWAHSKKQIEDVLLGVGSQAAFVASVVVPTTGIHRGLFDSASAMIDGGG